MTALSICSLSLQAQDTTKLYKGYKLSPVVIADINKGLDMNKFIERIQNDSTFYKAFKSLSLVSCTQYNDIRFFDKERNKISFYEGISKQKFDGRCRTMKNHNEQFSRNYFKRKRSPRYITASFYHKLFMLDKKECNENDIVNGKISSSNNSRIDQLKKLIFKPGEAIQGVPGVGRKVGIFEKKRKKQYNFSIRKERYNGTWCYVFSAIPKAEYKNSNVINYLHTWFSIKDYTILQRQYSLSYKTLMYDFDVDMKVKLKTFRKKLLPYEVYYKGNWHFIVKNVNALSLQLLLPILNSV